MARILIVEDNNEIQEILRTLLSEEHEVIQAFSGTEGMIRFEQGDIDLILLDIMLPGKNGDQVLKAIRHDSSVPVIMLTALSDKKLISQYLLDGANDYIVKPFEIIELLARVEAVLRRNHKINSLLEAGDISIDLRSRVVKKGGKEILLTKKEFDILVLLVQNSGAALYRETIYERVWGGDYMGNSRTVDLHVQRLRKKCGLEEKIVAVHKVGYRLEL